MAMKKFGKDARGHDDHEEIYHRHDDKPHAQHEEGEGWLISYADMMTLLCGFFIMLFSMAKLDEPEFEKVKKAVSKHFGGEYKSEAEDMTKYFSQVMQDLGVQDNVTLKTDVGGTTMAFHGTVFFDPMSAQLRPEAGELLSKLIEAIRVRQDTESKQYKVVVEGHTDSSPVTGGIYPSNWELSSARAARVLRLFVERGFSPQTVTAIGYGNTHPEVPEQSPTGEPNLSGMARNRRVVVRILDPKVAQIPMPDAPEGGREPAAAAGGAGSEAPGDKAAEPASAAVAPGVSSVSGAESTPDSSH